MKKEKTDHMLSDEDLFDKVLSCALTAEEIPGRELNEQLVLKAKERKKMKREEMINKKKSGRRGNSRKFPAAVVAAAVLCVSSISAVAAWKYLLPQQVAEHQSEMLAEAFAGEDAVMVNEVQEVAGYRITFLGVVSGEGLSGSIFENGQEVEPDSTYTVVAIEHADGTPMADTSADAYGDTEFFITPAIRGYNPVWYNAITLTSGETGSAGYMDMVEQGVLYRLSECHNMEVFADRELYLCVSESTFYDNQAYLFDEETGELSRNPEYGKVNALFSLPLDPSKADPSEAARILEAVDVPDLSEENDGGDHAQQETEPISDRLLLDMTEEERAAMIQEGVAMELATLQEIAEAEGRELTQEEMDDAVERATKIQTYIMQVRMVMLSGGSIDEYADCLESTVQILTPDEDGLLQYSYDLENGGAGSGIINVADCIEKYPELTSGFIPECLGWSVSEDGMADLRMETFWLNADGTVTFAVYVPKEEYR